MRARNIFSVVLFFATASAASSASAGFTCGGTIAAGTVVVADQDLLNCDQDPVVVVQSQATLDMGGHTISCDAGSEAGIFLSGQGTTLRNGRIVDCGPGVVVGGTGKHNISNVVTVLAGDGYLVIGGSAGNQLTDLVAIDTYDDGFDVASGGNSITSCIALRSGDQGFDIDGEGNTLEGNQAIGNLDADGNEGFTIANDGNVLTDNISAANDGGYDISTTGGDKKMKLIGNVSVANGSTGFFVLSTETTLKKNTSLLDSRGFASGGLKNKLIDNLAIGADNDGFNFGLAPQVKASKNRSILNDDDGFVVEAGAGLSFSKNSSLLNCGDGFLLNSFTASKLSKNSAVANCDRGVRITGDSSGNVVKGNVALGNNFGILIQSASDFNEISKNTVVGNYSGSDMIDENASCAANEWADNIFGTRTAGGVPDDVCIQ